MAGPPLRLLRLGNPFVRAVLRSRAHRLLSGSLALLTYRGRASGRTFTIPVMYATDGERVVVVAATPERKLWWRTFEGGAPATLVLQRAMREVTGHVIAGQERESALRAYVARFPRTSRAVAAGAAVVAFVPRAGTG